MLVTGPRKAGAEFEGVPRERSLELVTAPCPDRTTNHPSAPGVALPPAYLTMIAEPSQALEEKVLQGTYVFPHPY